MDGTPCARCSAAASGIFEREDAVDNPFLRRATELLRDDEAFLAIVSPEPVTHFLGRPGRGGSLYDRLVLLRGTPGSGKTTLARLFEYATLVALLRNADTSSYQGLAGAMTECRATEEGRPRVLGCRLPMETDYRDFWEFPYSDTLRTGLLTTFVQARAVLAWFRQLAATGVEARAVRIVPRPEAGTAVEAVGGESGPDVLERARRVEAAVYRVVGALVPPKTDELGPDVQGAYRPFDVIERFRVSAAQDQPIDLQPLVILDDAHALHPTQFRSLEHWLARRELRIARWIVTRFDVLQPQEAFAEVAEDRAERPDYPGLTASRDTEVVLLQSSGPRREQRTAFRRMGKDMAARYLQKHSLLGPRRLVVLGDLLSEADDVLSPSALRQLGEQVDAAQRRLKVADARRRSLEEEVEGFRHGGQAPAEDIRLAMVSILLHRYAKNRGQPSIFGDDNDPDPTRPLSANADIFESARLHLLHNFNRPFFRGIDDLCDAGSENAELFLQLAAVLVDAVATQVIRSKSSQLTAATQNALLRERGQRIIDAWNFPYHHQVRRLVRSIAARCLEETMEPNGWLRPNSFGIPQEEFDRLPETHPDLARVLQFAVAYNGLLVVPRRRQGEAGTQWCLWELGGMAILAHGLSLKRGGFIRGGIRDLERMLEEKAA